MLFASQLHIFESLQKCVCVCVLVGACWFYFIRYLLCFENARDTEQIFFTYIFIVKVLYFFVYSLLVIKGLELSYVNTIPFVNLLCFKNKNAKFVCSSDNSTLILYDLKILISKIRRLMCHGIDVDLRHRAI